MIPILKHQIGSKLQDDPEQADPLNEPMTNKPENPPGEPITFKSLCSRPFWSVS